MVSVEDVKHWCRIDGDEDDDLISSLIQSADEYFSNAGVKETTSELYSTGIKMFVKMMYEGTEEKVSIGLNTIILQLKNYEGEIDGT